MFALVRYTPKGALDPSFGARGTVTTRVGGTSSDAYAMAIQRDGKIVAAGEVASWSDDGSFALARYIP